MSEESAKAKQTMSEEGALMAKYERIRWRARRWRIAATVTSFPDHRKRPQNCRAKPTTFGTYG